MALPTIIDAPTINLGQRLRTITAQPAVKRATPLAGLVAIAAAIVLGWGALTAAPSRDLMPGMADGDKAAVAAALDGGGIKYRVDTGTGAIRVGGDDYHRARMLMASLGLPKVPAPALGIAVAMGASEAVEREQLEAGREADLARTIETIDAVSAARVHLATEAPSLFVRDRKPPRASVMLTMRAGASLGEEQVAAIANLVSASVSGLATADVAIVDQAGLLLSNSDGASAALAGQLGIQKRVEDRYREALATVLTPLLGRDGFTAEVHADLDFSATDATREGFPESARALRAEDQKWTRDGAGPPPAFGIPGTLSNTPPPATTLSTTPPAATVAGAATAGTTSQDVSRRFELGREVSVTRGAPGSVRRLSLAVAVRELPGKRRSRLELQAIDSLVRGAVGVDVARGDTVAVSARPFVVDEAAEPSWWQADWLAPALRFGGLALAVALGWFFVGRKLLRRYEAQTQAIRRGETQTLLGAELEGLPAQRVEAVTLEMIEAAPSYAARAELVSGFVRQNPAHAAHVLRTMLAKAPSND